MEDNKTKREIANEELGSDSKKWYEVLWENQQISQSQSNTEIPAEENILNDASSTVNNNFNVNINSSTINGNSEKQKSEAQTIINNVMNTINKDNPLLIKKNLKENSQESSNNILNLADSGFQNQNIPSENSFNDPESFVDYSEFLTPAPPMESLGIRDVTFDLPSIANYSYSVAKIKEENKVIQHRLESIKNIIDKALGEVSITEPGSAHQNNMFVQEMSDNKMYFDNTNTVFETNTNQNNYDQIEQLSREHHRTMEIRELETEKSLAETERQEDRKQSESIQTANEMRDVTPIPKVDYTPTVPSDKVDNRVTHMTNLNSSGYKLNAEINRPPVWRSVLG